MNSCPNCNSKSGVDIRGYDWCHACKSKIGLGKSLIQLDEVHRKKLSLPILPKILDENNLPKEAKNYINKYHIDQGSVFWSREYQRLCFPYFKTSSYELIGAWMRLVDEITTPEYRPKWMFAGNRNFSWYYYDFSIRNVNPESICLVEDVVSAIRISNFMDVICLGGTSISKNDIDIIDNYNQVVLFLDGDSAGQTATNKIRKSLKLTHDVKVIRSKKDPKEYSDEELRDLLNEFVNGSNKFIRKQT